MGGKDIIQHIAESAEIYVASDGKKYPVISLKAVTSITQAKGGLAREVEIAALKQGITPWRYLRNTGTIGLDGQIKLLQSTVAVVGAGGLGGTIIELLARQGIGHLIIIDNDRFAEQNLNRQLMSTEKNLGDYKATVAAKRVEDINSAVTATTFLEKLTKENAHRLLKDAKVVADGLDNLPSRFAVEEACRDLRIPFVHGTIAGFSGQLTTIFPEDAGLSCIYGSSDSLPEQGIEVKIGNPSATPAMIAAWQVQEIVKIITGIGKPLRNHLLMLDAMEGIADNIELSRY
jgi:molybdopterin/thiamine biosynthesis adenylyltransferase